MFTNLKNERLFWSLESVLGAVKKLEANLSGMIVETQEDRLRFARMDLQREQWISRSKVESHMQTIQTRVEKHTWASMVDVEKFVLSAWYAALEAFCALYERPSDESNCTDACLYAHRSIIRLCAGVPFYGCTLHGTVHYCTGHRCKVSITTAQFTCVCMFSGAEIGKELAQVETLANSFDSGISGQSAFNMFAAMNQKRDTIGRFDNSNINKVDMTDKWAEQIANGQELSMGESLFTKAGDLRKLNEAERRSYQFSIRVQTLERQAHARLVSVAGQIIDDMIFTDDSRELLNIQNYRQATERAREAVFDYVTKCKRDNTLPNKVSASQEYAGPFQKTLILPIVAKDTVRRAKYVSLCVRLWQLCHRTPFMDVLRGVKNSAEKHAVRQTTCTFAQFCLAVLYMHIDGLWVAGSNRSCFTFMAHIFEFIPRERILFVQLPPEDMVNVFGEKSTRRLRDHLMGANISETVGAGTGPLNTDLPEQQKKQSVDADLFNGDGQLRLRLRRHHRRKATMQSGNVQVTLRRSNVNERISAPESEVLPSHYHTALVGKTGSYEKSDIAAGRNFVRACINSILPHNIEKESKWLFQT
jgi:hypothetical protein